MQARDIMSAPAVTIGENATIGEAADLMTQKHVSCLPVVDDNGLLVGILTHADFVLHPKFMSLGGELQTLFGVWATPEMAEEVAKKVRNRPVKDVMEPNVVTTQEDSSVAEVVHLMLERNVNRVPVMRGQELVGIITRHDFLKLFLANDAPLAELIRSSCLS